MRAGVITPGAWNPLRTRDVEQREAVVREEDARPNADSWSKDAFAEEQIRGLVRQIFSPDLTPPVQQVVFSAVDRENDISNLCTWVGDVLSHERPGEIAVVEDNEAGPDWNIGGSSTAERRNGRPMRVRELATRVHNNLWSVSACGTYAEESRGTSLCAYMAELRREFEYSIVASPAWAASSKVLEMARFADGIVLVLSAQRTRRAAALRAKDALRNVRLLGTVLSDREFPIPSSIYRWL